MNILIIGHSEEENRFCRACAPVYTSEQLAQAAQAYLSETLGTPVQVTHVDAARPDVFQAHMDLIRQARREGLRFPLVFANGELILHGSAEPYAIARALRQGEKETVAPSQLT